MYAQARILNAGEGGLVVEFSDAVEERANRAVHALDAALQAELGSGHLRPGGPFLAVRSVPTFRSLLVLFDPLRFPRERLLEAVGRALRFLSRAGAVEHGGGQGAGQAGQGGGQGGDPPEGPSGPTPAGPGRLVEIPVCYSGQWGPDLPEVARLTGIPEERVVQLQTGRLYLVYMLGFQIGYPYMASLPPELRLPRLARPRLKTPRGAVAIAGELAGIYSLESPGGWRVLGNTPLPLWSLDWDPPTLLRPGDSVRFYAVTPEQHAEIRRSGWLPAGSVSPVGLPAASGEPESAAFLRVVRPGALATVQDLGRPGYERYGLGPGGAMDRFAIRVGNRLAGNAEGAAAVEVTAGGAEFELLRSVEFVWAGGHGELTLDGRRVAAWTVVRGYRGQRLSAGLFKEGFRGYLCPAGGLAAPRVAGSRSTNLAAGFGGHEGRALVPGDVLAAFAGSGRSDRRAAGKSVDPGVLAEVYGPLGEPAPGLRVVLGPQDDAFTPDGLEVFFKGPYRIGPESNRMGYRLEGKSVETRAGSDIVSDGIVAGAVQVPGNGQPVLLMADHQTTGGYAKLGVLASADLVVASQLAPGRELAFRRVAVDEASQARLRQEHAVGRAVGELLEFRLKIDGRTVNVTVDEERGG